MKNRLPELTGLRCIAVSMVVLGHAEGTVPGGYVGWLAPLKLFSNGTQGVLIFFVLSGFLITTLLKYEYRATGRINFLKFYMRRSLRIWPAFYIFIISIALLARAGKIDVDPRQLLFASLHVWNYSALLGLGPTSAAHPDGAWYLGHFWSLALEEQFYWFWPPLAIYMLQSRNDRILLAMILIEPLVRMASYFAMPGLRGQLAMMLHTGVDPILIGCYISFKYDKIKAWLDSQRYANASVTCLVVVLFFVIPFISRWVGGYWSATYGKTIEAAIVGIVIVTIIDRREFWLSRILRNNLFVFVGTISFSLYLWQQLFNGFDSPVRMEFPLNILQAFAAAAVSYWFVEVPFLRLKDNLGKNGHRPTIEPSGAKTE
ncbi:acyltransferase 3 [Burkholderia sp. lig30]|uniref:acyltransferase family protein n=1 Tax=Burkholderia sp. lig30 TaxID=1192124 RepID=UPI0004617277|nr:acyltransferase [Burkholderia sp. lig30]KDB09705.1 acyltransferase 3 [Burkholderia sp. lig30]